jgi:hypothetical protein
MVGRMPLTGEGQRSAQPDAHARHLVQPLAKLAQKSARDPHRPHGVGTRRPDADAKQIERG